MVTFECTTAFKKMDRTFHINTLITIKKGSQWRIVELPFDLDADDVCLERLDGRRSIMIDRFTFLRYFVAVKKN